MMFFPRTGTGLLARINARFFVRYSRAASTLLGRFDSRVGSLFIGSWFGLQDAGEYGESVNDSGCGDQIDGR